MKILSYRRFALWWQLAMDWFQRQFAAIAASIDFTPVEEKLDEVKSDVADVKLEPTAELDGNAVLLHFVTLAQMEKMHINTNAGIVGFYITQNEEDFQLRFSQDSPQEFAGEIVYEDSLDIKDDVFETIRVPLVGYEVTYVYIDGADADLLKADINWRLADIQSNTQSILQAVEPNIATDEDVDNFLDSVLIDY